MNDPLRVQFSLKFKLKLLLCLLALLSISVNAADLSVKENAGQLEVLVSFMPGVNCQERTGCSVSVVSVDGTAKSGTDYSPVNQRLRWNNGDGGSKALVVSIIDNKDKDGNRTFTLNAQDLVGITLPSASQSVEIVDDETSAAAPTGGGIEAPAQVVGAVIASVCPQVQDALAADSVALRDDCNSLQNAIANNDSNVAQALEAIAPDQAGALLGVGQQTITTQMRNISARMGAVRSNNRTALSDFGITINERTIAVADLFTGGNAGDEPGFASKYGFFVNGEISFGDREDTKREEGYDFSTNGLTLGVDYRISNQWVVGTALGFALSTSDFTSGGSLDSKGLLGTVFATLQRRSIYLEGGLSFGSNRFEQDRAIEYSLADGTDVKQTARSSFSGSESSFFLNSGMEFLLSQQLTLTPQIRFEFVQSDVDGFSEKSVSAANDAGQGWRVKMDSQSREKLLVGLALKASRVINTGRNVWVPYAGLEWVQDFKADKTDLSGKFLGDPGNDKFTLEVDPPDDNFFRLNFGTTMVFRNGKSAFFDYSTMLAVAHDTVHSFNAGFRWEF